MYVISERLITGYRAWSSRNWTGKIRAMLARAEDLERARCRYTEAES